MGVFRADPHAAQVLGSLGLQHLLGLFLHQLQQGPEARGAAEFRLAQQATQA